MQLMNSGMFDGHDIFIHYQFQRLKINGIESWNVSMCKVGYCHALYIEKVWKLF